MKNRFLSAAITEAEQGIATGEGGPFGAVIVRRAEIVSRAHNEVLLTGDPTAHAEMLAIRKAARRLQTYDLSGCILYTTCEPCPMCLGAVLWARISSVVYGCTASDAARIGFSDLDFHDMFRRREAEPLLKEGRERNRAAPEVPVSGIDRCCPEMVLRGRRECLRLFADWMRRPDRRLY